MTIKTVKELELARNRLTELLSIRHRSRIELDTLADNILAYEDEHFPLEFRADQERTSCAD